MNAREFDALSHSLGNEYLAPCGFVYTKNNWHYISDKYQISFLHGKDRNASYSQITYLTLCIRHLEDPNEEGSWHKGIIDNLDKNCPIQISPLKIKEFIQSDYSPECWKYSNAQENIRHPNVYYPLYFGGLDKWVMKDKSYSESENAACLKRNVETYGAELIHEKKAKSILIDAMQQIAEYGKEWAEYLTPQEIMNQITNYGDNWWIEKNWVDRYGNRVHGRHEI